MKDEIADLLLTEIDVKGELHLDADKTKLLLRWLRSVQRTMEQQNILVDRIKNMLSKEG